MPAGLCGVVGLKPTFGRVSNSGWVLTSVGFFFQTLYGYLYWLYFCFRYALGPCTMQEPSHLGKTILVSIWFRMVVTQIITRVYKDSLALTYPPNTDSWLVLQFWRYPRVGSSIPLLMLIIDIHTCTCIPDQQRYWQHSYPNNAMQIFKSFLLGIQGLLPYGKIRPLLWSRSLHPSSLSYLDLKIGTTAVEDLS